MRNAEIAAAMEELGTLYELDGAVRFRVLAYREAARVIRSSPVSIAELAREGKATELPGIGATLQDKIIALLDTGDIPSAVKLRAKFPASLLEVTRIPGLGAKTVRRLYDELGVASLDDLREAAEQQRIRELKGLGREGGGEHPRLAGEDGRRGRAGAAAALPGAADRRGAGRGPPRASRVGRGRDRRLGAAPRRDLQGHRPDRDRHRPGGAREVRSSSTRWSRSPATPAPPAPTSSPTTASRWTCASSPPKELGNLLQHFTGSAAHNIELRERAVAEGLSVSEHGIKDVETRQGHALRDRGRRLQAPGPPLHRARAARGAGRARRRARGQAPGARRGRRTSRATSTATRRSPTGATRWRRWRRRPASAATPTWRSPTTRPATGSATTSRPTRCWSGSRRSRS